MKKRLSASSYIFIGSMLFGMFFGAGNLIFPVHMGQEAGSNVLGAAIGFLITAIGLPFLGVVAIGVSRSSGLFDLSSRVHPVFGYIMTILLYLTIGPFFACPRTATVSYEIGVSPFISEKFQILGLVLFSLVFFIAALLFSMKPSKIMTWIGKILNPMFLFFLTILVAVCFIHPMGSVLNAAVNGAYASAPFFKGFVEGYNTMDALASLAFGIIVVNAFKNLGVDNPKDIAFGTVKSGLVSLILMGVIYACLAYIGATSVGKFKLSENGGIALSQIAHYYFGTFGSILLAVIITLACLKTAIGLITACAETFHSLFPKLMEYKAYVVLFTVVSCLIANVGLTKIIALSVPVLMLLYPLAIALIVLTFLSPLFKQKRFVYLITVIFTAVDSIADGLNAMPASVTGLTAVHAILGFYQKYMPFFNIGMGWVVPMLAGLGIGFIIFIFRKDLKQAA